MNRIIKQQKLDALKRLSDGTDSAILVEGIKDRRVLTKLGFTNIYTISGKPMEAIVELVCSDDPTAVSILTDFDREGRKKYRHLTKIFQSHQQPIKFTFCSNQTKPTFFRKLQIISISRYQTFSETKLT